MKLLLDQGLPRSTANLLREAGFDTVHVGKIGYFSAEDAAILEKAKAERRVVVMLDADFHALLALSEAVAPQSFVFEWKVCVEAMPLNLFRLS